MFASKTLHTPTRAFTRYAFAIQYHGGNLLGFSYQGRRGENCIIYEKHTGRVQADLRGIESVEGRIRRALDELVGIDNHSNIRVSSRTDRGVHAWRNTFQVDIRPRLRKAQTQTNDSSIETASDKPPVAWHPRNLVSGLNYYMSRLSNYPDEGSGGIMNAKNNNDTQEQMQQQQHANANKRSRSHLSNIPQNNICILSSAVAPDVTIPNLNYDPNLPENDDTNPKSLPWDVRYSATRRTYAYQILHSYDDNDTDTTSETENSDDNHHTTDCYHSEPFEHDRSWRIHERKKEMKGLDINAMTLAGQHLVGTHDFTSFRGKGCQRFSPVVTLEDVWIGREKYHSNGCGSVLGGVWRRTLLEEDNKENVKDGNLSQEKNTRPYLASIHTPETLHLVTIVITGKSFVYHQVRNIVACLVDVGKGRLKPKDVKDILEKKDRSCAPGMAPARGLFLVDVEHGDFRF